ncbi:polymorphic toxin type 44 domain-containing protein [Rossellomorea marisflavi]|uniref:polymorphic toxin type 44 domain-containing protein n=1 Tax=Rossellomorea marisflavi TaxID=189381 RepID=UPI003D2EBCB1
MKKNVLKVVVSFSLLGVLVPATFSNSAEASESPKNEIVDEQMSNNLDQLDSLSERVDYIADQEEKNSGEVITEESRKEIEKMVSETIKEANARVEPIKRQMEEPENYFSIQSLEITDSQIVRLYKENSGTATSIRNLYLDERKKSVSRANAYRLSVFYELVKTGGAWDLKQFLGKDTKYYFKGNKMTGEYIGNHHYGYMGKAVSFSNTTLKAAAGMYQVYSGTYKMKWIKHYFDDPRDQAAITAGYRDYNDGYKFKTIIS